MSLLLSAPTINNRNGHRLESSCSPNGYKTTCFIILKVVEGDQRFEATGCLKLMRGGLHKNKKTICVSLLPFISIAKRMQTSLFLSPFLKLDERRSSGLPQRIASSRPSESHLDDNTESTAMGRLLCAK